MGWPIFTEVVQGCRQLQETRQPRLGPYQQAAMRTEEPIDVTAISKAATTIINRYEGDLNMAELYRRVRHKGKGLRQSGQIDHDREAIGGQQKGLAQGDIFVAFGAIKGMPNLPMRPQIA